MYTKQVIYILKKANIIFQEINRIWNQQRNKFPSNNPPNQLVQKNEKKMIKILKCKYVYQNFLQLKLGRQLSVQKYINFLVFLKLSLWSHCNFNLKKKIFLPLLLLKTEKDHLCSIQVIAEIANCHLVVVVTAATVIADCNLIHDNLKCNSHEFKLPLFH